MAVSWRALRGVVVALTLAEVSAQAQNSSECGSGAAAAAVVFAILFLLALVALGLVLYKYVWKPRHSEYSHVSSVICAHLCESCRRELYKILNLISMSPYLHEHSLISVMNGLSSCLVITVQSASAPPRRKICDCFICRSGERGVWATSAGLKDLHTMFAGSVTFLVLGAARFRRVLVIMHAELRQRFANMFACL